MINLLTLNIINMNPSKKYKYDMKLHVYTNKKNGS